MYDAIFEIEIFAGLGLTSLGPATTGDRTEIMGSRATRELRRKAMEEGYLPHEFLLRIVRGEGVLQKVPGEGGKLKEVKVYPSLEVRVDVAKAIAPYFAPRLSSQQVQLRTPTEELSDEELEARIRELLPAAGLSPKGVEHG